MSFLYNLAELFGTFSSSQIPINSIVNNDVVELHSGLGYMSALRLNGSLGMFGPRERISAHEFLLTSCSTLLKDQGQQLQWVTENNPDQARRDLREISRVSRETWGRLNVNMDVIARLTKDKEERLAAVATRENNFLTVTTSLSALTRQQQNVDAENAQRSLGGLKLKLSDFTQMAPTQKRTLLQRHMSNLGQLKQIMQSPQIQQVVDEVSAHQLIQEVRRLLLPYDTPETWRPAVQGREAHFSVQSRADDHSRLPHLRDQILPYPIRQAGDGVLMVGPNRKGRYFAIAYMWVHPGKWMAADTLMDGMPRDFHWWTSSTWVGGSDKWRSIVRSHQGVAQSLKILSSVNADIAEHGRNLSTIAQHENLCGYRMQVVTSAETAELAQQQIFILLSQLSAWGGSLWRQDVDDPSETLKHALPGCDRITSYAGQTFAVPTKDALVTMPFSRPGSAWARHLSGSLMMLTEAMRLYAYKQAAPGLQDYVSDLLIAPMGGGKSVLFQAIKLAMIEGYASHGLLPRMATLDIGPSSSGLIDLLKAILPKDMQWQVEFRTLSRDSDDSCINPFDTQLCVWWPTIEEYKFLENFLVMLFTSPERDAPPEGISGIIPILIQNAYEKILEDGGTRLKQYTPGFKGYEVIDQFVEDRGLNSEKNLSWKHLAERLFDARLYQLAEYAQWRAMPTIPDLSDILSSTREITDFFGKQMVEGLGITTIEYMQAMLVSASRSKLYGGATTFRTNARITALDNNQVVSTTGRVGIRESGLILLLGRHALTRKWWIDKDILQNLRCRPEVLRYHHEVWEREKTMPSRLDVDEYHITKSLPPVRAQFKRDRRVIRKYNIHYGIASQSDEDFDADDAELASTVFFLKAPSDEAIQRIAKRWGLKSAATAALRDKVRGATRAGAHILMWANTKRGTLAQYLVFPLPPIFLWAFSSTSDDVTVRRRLVERLGYLNALLTLSKQFAGGSAESRLEELKNKHSDQPPDVVMNIFIDELESYYHENREAILAG
ncbi:TPA: hypothetical protein NIF74_002184 [Pseudomonas aeruginosa]|nr:hypothetical protein [Pseudomonas aeruginosa]HCF4889622.1 hypothetical protein [Pseudomonas aeruginosa]HCF5102238.1 hypothetical protein [Pseudomonas aeruginosa]